MPRTPTRGPMPPTASPNEPDCTSSADAAGSHARQHRADPGRRAAGRHHAHAVRPDHPRVVRAAQLGQPDRAPPRRGPRLRAQPGHHEVPRAVPPAPASMPATAFAAPSPTQARSGTWSRSAIDGTTDGAAELAVHAGACRLTRQPPRLQVADELPGHAVALRCAEHDGGRGLEERPQVGPEEGCHVPVCGDGSCRRSSIDERVADRARWRAGRTACRGPGGTRGRRRSPPAGAPRPRCPRSPPSLRRRPRRSRPAPARSSRRTTPRRRRAASRRTPRATTSRATGCCSRAPAGRCRRRRR